jgi:hypothetical protein
MVGSEIAAISRLYTGRDLLQKMLLPIKRMAIGKRIGDHLRGRQAGASCDGFDTGLQFIRNIERNGHRTNMASPKTLEKAMLYPSIVSLRI